MKLAFVVAALLVTSVAGADRAKDPAHHKQARAFLKTLLESKDNPPASAAKPVAVYLDSNDEAACDGVGDIKDAAGMTKLKTCVKALKKGFPDKVDEVGADDVKATKFLEDFPPQVRKEVKAMVKDARLVKLGFNGDGETLRLTVAVAKDGTVKSLFVTSEAVE